MGSGKHEGWGEGKELGIFSYMCVLLCMYPSMSMCMSVSVSVSVDTGMQSTATEIELRFEIWAHGPGDQPASQPASHAIQPMQGHTIYRVHGTGRHVMTANKNMWLVQLISLYGGLRYWDGLCRVMSCTAERVALFFYVPPCRDGICQS